MVTKHSDNQGPLYIYRFGTAEFDAARFELRVAGLAVEVQRRPLEVLAILLARVGEVVTHQELQATLWEGRTVSDNVVANAINKVRGALGDENAALIVTQPRVGYRLACAVERIAAGRPATSRLDLIKGEPVPGRPHFQLLELLSASQSFEVWTAQHAKTRELRVYKFALAGVRLSGLKREATLFRVLTEQLGPRRDLTCVLDWNFETAPYFLECEYGGLSLSEWGARSDAQSGLTPLTRGERMRLFLQIAEAVAAAHSIGVLHKDLKPANVLISREPDAGWQIKLTDFGSGRLLEPERLAEMGITQLGFTMTTALGSDSSGTLLYLAPELLAQQPPTVKSDLYALGIMLYQLLVGNLKQPMVSGWQRDIDDELLREDIAAATDGNPHHRLNSVAELIQRLQSLEQRRTQAAQARARAAESLALQEALRRSRARRPWIAATFSVVVLGLITTLFFYVRAARSERALVNEKMLGEQLNAFLTDDLIGAANPENAGRSDVTVLDAARIATQRIDGQSGSGALALRAALHAAMQKAFSGLEDHQNALQEGRKALALYQQAGNDTAEKLDSIKLQLARSLIYTTQYDAGAALLSELERTAAAQRGAATEFQVQLALARGYLLSKQLHHRQAITFVAKAQRLARTLPPASVDLRDRVDLELARLYTLAGDFGAGEKLLRPLLARQLLRLERNSLPVVNTMVELGQNLQGQERFDEATPLIEEVIQHLTTLLGSRNGRLRNARSLLAGIYYDQGNLERALALWSNLLLESASQPGEEGVRVFFQANIGEANYALERKAAAEKAFRAALDMAGRFEKADSPLVNTLRYSLANCLLDLQRPTEAAPLLAGLDAKAIRSARDLGYMDSRLLYQAGRIALQTGHPAEALRDFEQARALMSTEHPDPHTYVDDLETGLRTMTTKAQTLLKSRRVR